MATRAAAATVLGATLVVAALLLGAGCASVRTAKTATVERPSEPLGQPWLLPPGSRHSQRIFGLQFRSDRGRGSLALTLRLERADRFQVVAVDRVLRRKLLTVEVVGERALSVLHREHTFCWHEREIELAALPLGPIPLPSLANLLVGVLPIEPTAQPAGAPAEPGGFVDGAGRRWSYTLADGWPARWTMETEGGASRVSYQRSGRSMVLRAPAEGLVLRWQEKVRQPLAANLDPDPQPPPGFAEECGGPERSARESLRSTLALGYTRARFDPLLR